MSSVKLQKGQKKNEYTATYVSSNPACMPWRELSSILSIRETNGRKSALALRHLNNLAEKSFTLWTGGLYSEKAKEITTVEWVAKLSIGMLEEPAMRLYEEAISVADRQQYRLHCASTEYAKKMLVDDASRFSSPAENSFWDLLASPENQLLVMNVNSKTYLADWKNAVRAAAEEAYRRACPSTTARQMEAYTQGLTELHVSDKNIKQN